MQLEKKCGLLERQCTELLQERNSHAEQVRILSQHARDGELCGALIVCTAAASDDR